MRFEAVAAQAEKEGAAHVIVSAAIEAEISQLDPEDKAEFLAELGLAETGLARLIRAGVRPSRSAYLLHRWTKRGARLDGGKGASAPEAAGVIHTDFQRGFIRAETISYDDYIACKGEAGARDAGKLRIEGADYKVADGDVFHFRFNV